MKKLFLLFILAVMTTSIMAVENAETSTKAENAVMKTIITGTVIDPQTKETIAGASVVVNGKKVFTDFDGNFQVEVAKDKTCDVSVSMISYNNKNLMIKPSEKNHLEIALKQ